MQGHCFCDSLKDKDMKTDSIINVLHTESSPSLGGQELHILLEMEAMVACGINSILAARTDTPIVHEARRRNLPVYEVPIRFNLEPKSMWRLGGIMKKHRIQVLNAHGSKDAWCAAPVARLRGIKIIRSRHIATPISDDYIGQLIYGPLCDVITTAGEGIKRGMVEKGIPADKIISVPIGADMKQFLSARPGTLRQDLHIPPDVPLVGQISVLRRDRGGNYFIRAAQLAIERGSDAWFVLVGDGPERKNLESLLADNPCGGRIKLAGFRHDIPEVLSDLQLFVITSTIPEGACNSVGQAHAAKVPVIATHQIGLDELAIDQKTARCVRVGSPEEMAEAVLFLLSHPEEAQRLCQAGHDLIKSGYTYDHTMAKMKDIYKRLSQRSSC